MNTEWQHKALPKLLGLSYQIIYKKGTKNSAVDSLSRRPNDQNKLFAISSAQLAWLEEALHNYVANTKAQELLQQLSIDPHGKVNFQLCNGTLMYKACIWIG